MKSIYCALVVCISVISFNCQKELSFNRGNFDHTSTSSITATVQGNVFDENGKAAIDVTIKAGTKSAVTNARGYFRIVSAVLDKGASLVTAEKKGYFKSYRTFIATSGVNQVMIKLARRNLSSAVSSTSGGEVSLSNGSKISLPANGFVKASGGNYDGSVNVYASYIDPASQDIALTVPGSFMADDKDNKRVFLTSYGMLAVELESTLGEKLQIASGSTATLTMPIPASMQAAAPTSISLWYIDDPTGIWKEEGTATKTGNSYVGQVKHFSFWNCDYGASATKVAMTLHNGDGKPLVYVHVAIDRTAGGRADGWTDSLGQVSGLVPAYEILNFKVLDQCNDVIYSQDIGPFTDSTYLGVITVTNAGPSVVTVKGKVLNCNNIAVANGDAVIYYDNLVRYAITDNNGEFSTSFITCRSAPTTCQVLGVDNVAQQQGAVLNISVVSPLTNAGNISACGGSSLQYINYILDGVSYSVSSMSPGDSLNSNTADSSGVLRTRIWGFQPPSGIMGFGFTSNGTAGSYPNDYLNINGIIRSELGPPLSVVISNFANKSGEFYEGGFSGQLTDALRPTNTHTVACSFRIRR